MPLIQWLRQNLHAGDGIEVRACEAMYRRFHERWPLVEPSVPYTFENESHQPEGTPWIRVSALHTISAQATSGVQHRQFERRGRLFVQIFGNADAGRRPLADLAFSVRGIMQGRSISIPGRQPVRMYEGASREGVSDGRWALEVVSVPFAYRETR